MLLRVREVCSLDWSNEYNSTNDIHPVASRNGSLVPYLAARRNIFVNANTYFSTSMFSEKCYGLQSSSRKRRQKILKSSIRIVSSPQSFNVPLAGFFGRLSWITRLIALKPAVLGWKDFASKSVALQDVSAWIPPASAGYHGRRCPEQPYRRVLRLVTPGSQNR